ncbi:MAG: NAD(P)-dependent oxidoreductase [Planctomycetota bacterium]
MNRDTTLVVGASGATGRLLVEQLLRRGQYVRAVVRPCSDLPGHLLSHENLTVVSANISDLTQAEWSELVAGCGSFASCLGHNLSFKGIFGKPRKLVTDAVRGICQAASLGEPARPHKFVLMNTTGNINHDLGEVVSVGQRLVLALLRLLVPPHADNEQAANHLRLEVGQDHPRMEWVAVRPDGLIDEEHVADYDLHPSPTRSAIFNAGKTRRINVAHFMAELIADEGLWSEWKGQMPVIYDAG